jgi:hypothetical protein
MRETAYEKYCRIELEISDKFKRYVEGGWCRRSDDQKDLLLQDFDPSGADFLAANNVYARMKFAKVSLQHVADYFGTGGGFDKTPYLATLIPVQYAVNLGGGKDIEFNLDTIKSWTRHQLGGRDFLGIVEPALFTNWRKRKNVLSIHVHCFLWNVDERTADELAVQINSRTKSLLKHVPAADIRPIMKGTEKTTWLYMMKSPTAEYRVYPKKRTVPDPIFGGTMKEETGYWGVHKDVMRPGLYLAVRDATQGWFLDRMVFAGGEGKVILDALKEEALAAIPLNERGPRNADRPL